MEDNLEWCELLEVDSEQIRVIFQTIPTVTPHFISRSFDSAFAILEKAGWGLYQGGVDAGGDRVASFRRVKQDGRAIDDALDDLK